MKKFEYAAVPVGDELLATISVNWNKFCYKAMNDIIRAYCSEEEIEILENLRSWTEAYIGKVIKTSIGNLMFKRTSLGVEVYSVKEIGMLYEVSDEEFDWI